MLMTTRSLCQVLINFISMTRGNLNEIQPKSRMFILLYRRLDEPMDTFLLDQSHLMEPFICNSNRLMFKRSSRLYLWDVRNGGFRQQIKIDDSTNIVSFDMDQQKFVVVTQRYDVIISNHSSLLRLIHIIDLMEDSENFHLMVYLGKIPIGFMFSFTLNRIPQFSNLPWGFGKGK